MAALTKQRVSHHRDSSVQRVSTRKTKEVPLVQHLQRQVANAFVLFGNYKHYHWQTYPPLFREDKARRIRNV